MAFLITIEYIAVYFKSVGYEKSCVRLAVRTAPPSGADMGSTPIPIQKSSHKVYTLPVIDTL